MKPRAFTMISLSFAGILVVLLLNWQMLRQKHKLNGFNRKFIKQALLLQRISDLKYNSYYFSGIDSNRIYLGNYNAPTRLLIKDLNLKDLRKIDLIADEPLPINSVSTKVNFSNIYLVNLLSTKVLKSKIPNNILMSHLGSAEYSSLEIMPISNSSYAVIKYDTTSKQTVITKISDHSELNRTADNLLQKQVDGIFCTDGMFHFNTKSGFLTYIYYYRNQFIKLDTNLNLIFRANTIDTNSVAKVSSDMIKSDHVYKLSSPPVFVNRASCVSGHYLYIHSALKADHQDQEEFDKNAVIDIYDLVNGKYKGSFYLPSYHGEKARSFRVSDHYIISLHGRYMLKSKLPDFF